MTTLTSNISIQNREYFSTSFNEINSKNDQTDNIYAFALQTLPIKIINAIILYYTCFIIEKLKTAAVHPNDCREMKLTVKGK